MFYSSIILSDSDSQRNSDQQDFSKYGPAPTSNNDLAKIIKLEGRYFITSHTLTATKTVDGSLIFNLAGKEPETLPFDVPCYWQHKPLERSIDKRISSHSHSYQSYRKWASRNYRKLEKTFRQVSNTHFATIKFNAPVWLSDYKAFWGKLKDSLAYRGIAGFAKLEIERNNHFHNHILLRTEHLRAEDTLTTLCYTLSRGIWNDGAMAVAWVENIKCQEAAAKYTVKFQKDWRGYLFKPDYRLHLVQWWGRYFL